MPDPSSRSFRSSSPPSVFALFTRSSMLGLRTARIRPHGARRPIPADRRRPGACGRAADRRAGDRDPEVGRRPCEPGPAGGRPRGDQEARTGGHILGQPDVRDPRRADAADRRRRPRQGYGPAARRRDRQELDHGPEPYHRERFRPDDDRRAGTLSPGGTAQGSGAHDHRGARRRINLISPRRSRSVPRRASNRSRPTSP